MAGYIKKIAVIKQLKSGFSADGGVISGLVKLETYAGYLKAEVSLINFAPLSEGRYVFGISDGVTTVVFEDVSFECESALNAENGFAFVVCFCHGGASPIASACCGQVASALPALKDEIQKREQAKPDKTTGAAYDDEAITEVNYYENQTDKDDKPLRENQKEEGGQPSTQQNEEAVRPVQGTQVSVIEQPEEELLGGLAGGDFFSRMRGDIEKIFATYPKESDLEKVLEGSRFVKIGYGENKYYVFGVLYIGGNAAYVCYGVPSLNSDTPPKSLKGFSSYIPCKNGGYWMTYQDARTGVSVDIVVN